MYTAVILNTDKDHMTDRTVPDALALSELLRGQAGKVHNFTSGRLAGEAHHAEKLAARVDSDKLTQAAGEIMRAKELLHQAAELLGNAALAYENYARPD